MKLYFLRHAEAVDGPDEADRLLSPRGKKQAREVGRFLKRAAVEFDAAYSSALLRSKQTGEIVLDVCGSTTLEITEALLNETAQTQFGKWLKNLPAAEHVLLVGHAPSLGERVRQLIGMATSSGLKLPKGGVACVDFLQPVTAISAKLIRHTVTRTRRCSVLMVLAKRARQFPHASPMSSPSCLISTPSRR